MEAIDTLWHAQVQFPTDGYLRNELAKMLRASGDVETAQSIYRMAVVEFPDNPWCLAGLADLLLQRNRVEANKSLIDEARSLFLRAAAMGNTYASTRLENMDRQDEEANEGVDLGPLSQIDMRPPQQLGRALLLQWRARRSASSAEREHLFAKAGKMLEVSDELQEDAASRFWKRVDSSYSPET